MPCLSWGWPTWAWFRALDAASTTRNVFCDCLNISASLIFSIRRFSLTCTLYMWNQLAAVKKTTSVYHLCWWVARYYRNSSIIHPAAAALQSFRCWKAQWKSSNKKESCLYKSGAAFPACDYESFWVYKINTHQRSLGSSNDSRESRSDSKGQHFLLEWPWRTYGSKLRVVW